jgi:chaperonin GroES
MGNTFLEQLPKPLQDRVLVRRDPDVEQIGSIVVPDSAKTPCLKGTVLDVGPGRVIDGELHATQVKKGQRVLLSPSVTRNWPDIIQHSGIIMVQENDLLGILEG